MTTQQPTPSPIEMTLMDYATLLILQRVMPNAAEMDSLSHADVAQHAQRWVKKAQIVAHAMLAARSAP